jgi:protein required for attachment to host cells
MSTWILVSDASRAVLYETEKREDDWQVLGAYSQPESRMKNCELTPTEPGHAAQSKGGTRHTAFQPATSPKEASVARFAEQLAGVLAQGVVERRYDRLVLVAPPRFLGILRQHLTAETKACLAAEVNKDYTLVEAHELRDRLQDSVFASVSHDTPLRSQ